MITIGRPANYGVGFLGHSKIWDGAQETVVSEPGHDVWGVVCFLIPIKHKITESGHATPG